MATAFLKTCLDAKRTRLKRILMNDAVKEFSAGHQSTATDQATWSEARIIDIADIEMGQSPPSDTYNLEGIGLPFFQGKAEFGSIHPGVVKYCSAPKKTVEANSIILSIRAPVGPTNIVQQKSCIGRGLAGIKPLDKVSPLFILYLFRSIESYLSNEGTGSTFKAISGDFLKSIRIGVPPLPEQHRIVAKIEELFSEIDNGIDNLKTAQTKLKAARQSLLKAAFEGKLTEQWREENADKLESPQALLERIQAEREVRHQQQLADWQRQIKDWDAAGKEGKKPRKPKALKTLSPLTEEELAGLPELSKGWGWCTPELMVTDSPYALGIGPFGSNLKVSDYKEKGIPLVFVKNITRRNFSLDEKYITAEKADELYAHQAEPGDILITKMGNPPGDATIYPETACKAVITADCLKLRINEKFFDKSFVCSFITSVFAKRQLGLITRGVAQKKISVARFKEIKFPLLSVEEQQEIAQTLESHLSQIDQLEQNLAATLKQAESLKQSILKRAFAGKLVPQDPDDEPSSELLARIRTEREMRPKAERSRRKEIQA